MPLDVLEDNLNDLKRRLDTLVEGKPGRMSWREYKLRCQATYNSLRDLNAFIAKNGVLVYEGPGGYRTVPGDVVAGL